MGPMVRLGDTMHIPLSESEALRLMLQVKPTAGTPRRGATKAKKKTGAKLPK